MINRESESESLPFLCSDYGYTSRYLFRKQILKKEKHVECCVNGTMYKELRWFFPFYHLRLNKYTISQTKGQNHENIDFEWPWRSVDVNVRVTLHLIGHQLKSRIFKYS